MFKNLKEFIKNHLAVFMSRYLMPDYEAHKRAELLYTSAETIALRRDLKRAQAKLEKAEAHVRMFCEISDNIVRHALDADDSETTPFMHKTIVELENGRRYVN